jgi:hypothetical protein
MKSAIGNALALNNTFNIIKKIPFSNQSMYWYAEEMTLKLPVRKDFKR